MTWPSRTTGSALLLAGVIALLLAAGCGGSNECTWDSDCPEPQQCVVGGGPLFGGGRCIPPSAQILPADATDVGPDTNQPDTSQPCLPESVGTACTVGTGECAESGTFVCRDGILTCSATPDQPSAEVCDSRDNDCDGQVDEDLMKACQRQQGVCQGSTVECQDGSFPSCGGAEYGSGFVARETSQHCDSQDNDCDGRTDEECDCTDGETQDCGSSTGVCEMGTQTCTNGSLGPCQGDTGPSMERCDGKDNDCDGMKDEDFPRKGMSCTVDRGACENTGVYVCAPDKEGTACSANPGSPSAETCNGVDDDCDGQIDEQLTRSCGKTEGVCVNSEEQCTSGAWGSCMRPADWESTESTCNDGKDNDCDGDSDIADSDCKLPGLVTCSSNAECLSGDCDSGTCAQTIFVTSTTSKGDLGGLSGADTMCNSAAMAAGRRGSWKAVVSTQGNPAKSRLTVSGPLYNTNGEIVANGRNDLWDGKLDNAVGYDASGNPTAKLVWTGTDSDGRWDGADENMGEDCISWTSATTLYIGEVGKSNLDSDQWITGAGPSGMGQAKCNASDVAIYCVDGQ